MTVSSTQGAPVSWQYLDHDADARHRLEQLLKLADSAINAGDAPPFSDQSTSVIHQYMQAGTAEDRRRTGLNIIFAYPSESSGSHGSEDSSQPEDPTGPENSTEPENFAESDSSVESDVAEILAAAVTVTSPASPEQPAGSVVAELLVSPHARGRGIGSLIAKRLEQFLNAQWPEAEHLLWAHGADPAAFKIADAHGWSAIRELWQMSLTADVELPEATIPEGMTLSTFTIGADEQAWLALNASAFADHPEQGQLGIADLNSRIAEEWFDPSGFFLIWDDGELIGFHWTKIARGNGEVYAVGVNPSAQGQGLGAALTVIGINHLRSRNVAEVILYVDAENTAATALYQRLGFTIAARDTQYRVDP